MMIQCAQLRDTNYLIESIKTRNISVIIRGYFSNFAILKYIIILIGLTVLKYFSSSIMRILRTRVVGEYKKSSRYQFFILLFITIICKLVLDSIMEYIIDFLKKCILDLSREQLQDALLYLNTSSLSSRSTWRLYEINELGLYFIFKAISIISSLISLVIVMKSIIEDADSRRQNGNQDYFDMGNFASLSLLSVIFMSATYLISSGVSYKSNTYEYDYEQVSQYSQLINRCGQMNYANDILNERFINNDMAKEKFRLGISLANTLVISGCCMAFYFDIERSGFINRVIQYEHNGYIISCVYILLNILLSIMFTISSLLRIIKDFKDHCKFIIPLLYDTIPNKNIVLFKYFSIKFTDLSFDVKKFATVANLFIEDSQEDDTLKMLIDAINNDSTHEIKKLIENVSNQENKKQLQELYDEIVLIKNCHLKIGHNQITFVENNMRYDIKFKNKMLMCIRGDSGSGKTSLIKLLFGLTSSPQVSATINNCPIEQVQLNQLSKFVAVILQKPHFFSRFTVMDNFKFLGATDENKIKKQLVRFGIHEKVKDSMNDDLKYLYLSGGESFRLAFSFFYAADKKPPIIVIDECLSALDVDTQKDILHKIIEENDENFDGTFGSSIIHIEHLGLFRDLCNIDVHLYNKELNFSLRINGKLTDVKTLMSNRTEFVNDDYIITKQTITSNDEEILNDTDLIYA